MNLRDSVQILGPVGEWGEDAHGNPIPPPMGVLSTPRAHVFYSSAVLIWSNDSLRPKEELRCIIPPQSFEIDANLHTIVWRGTEYRIDGDMTRSAAGQVHHLTLTLTRIV